MGYSPFVTHASNNLGYMSSNPTIVARLLLIEVNLTSHFRGRMYFSPILK